MVDSIVIAAFCGANLVYNENNYVFVSYFTYGSMHFLQFSAHLKLDTDELALLRLHLFECIIERVIACEQVL